MSTPFQAQTDTPKKITLESHLVAATWLGDAVYGGFDAKLEIITTFVSYGSPIKIKCCTEKGKTITNVEAKVTSKRLVIDIPIPEKVPVGELAYCIVKLPKHGLEIDSNSVITCQPIRISSMKWGAKEVRREDVVKLSVKFASEIPDNTDALVVIYEYDSRGRHDPVVKIPTVVKNNALDLHWEFQYPGHTSKIPTEADLQPYGRHYQQPQFFFVVVIDGIKLGENQESGLLRFKDFLEILLLDHYDNPLRNHNIEITYADGSNLKTKTDSTGLVNISETKPGSVNLTYELPLYETLEIKLLSESFNGDEFIILHSNDTPLSYYRKLSLNTDAIFVANYHILDFEGMYDSLSYTLEIYDSSMTMISKVFENIKYGHWA